MWFNGLVLVSLLPSILLILKFKSKLKKVEKVYTTEAIKVCNEVFKKQQTP